MLDLLGGRFLGGAVADPFKTRIFNTGLTVQALVVTVLTVGPAAVLLMHLSNNAEFIRHHAEVGALVAVLDGGIAAMLLFTWGYACWHNLGKSLKISVDGVGYYHKDRDFFQVDWKEMAVRDTFGMVELQSPRGRVRLYSLFFPQFGAVRRAIEEAQVALKVKEQTAINRLVEQAEEASAKIRG